MLAHLSISDIVLIARLAVDFSGRLSVLTGATGAGKSIVLDSFAMALGARVYYKPKSMAEAEAHLLSLSGKVHRLNSAAVLVRKGEVVWQTVSSAELAVRTLSPEFVFRHLQRVGEMALSSVGAYQLEGEGIQLFTSIQGDYFTILGLPLLPLLSKLRDLDVIDG